MQLEAPGTEMVDAAAQELNEFGKDRLPGLLGMDLLRERITVLDPPADYPQYGPQYYAVFFADPDGMKLELLHFPWGYWRKVQTDGSDARPRYAPRTDS